MDVAAKIQVPQVDPERPSKKVHKPEDLQKWLNSQAYHDYLAFIHLINDAVQGKSVTDDVPISENAKKLLDILDTLDKWVDEIPPQDDPKQRFGNKSFTTWQGKLVKESVSLVEDLLTDEFKEYAKELSAYLNGSFGNPTRIDYGTGHEARFATFLCALMKVRVLCKEDALAIGFRLFTRYLDLARKIQKTYRLEPAGSQGVWGLDDYQFLPFIWGSAQFMGDNPIISPGEFVEPMYANKYHKEYMFLACIKYINEVKSGPFAEHSNALWNISDVREWSKVNAGLIKMYKADVLQKFPVIQHYLFGKVMSIEAADDS